MRSMFPGYYRPTKIDFAEKFKSCIFCFDTNVLLNIYRYTSDSRDNLIKVLQHSTIKDRIWIPHRVGFEYHRRRTDVLLGQVDLTAKAEGIVDAAINSLEKLCRTDMFAVNVLIDPIKTELEAVKAKLHSKKGAKPDLLEGDQVFNALTELFEGKVGKPYEAEQENEVYKKGKGRYDARVPPGYEDRSNSPNETDQYGDLVIWFQLIDHAKDQNRPVILVTDDGKEDWWREVRGERLGPRVELIEEFAKATNGNWFYMYSTEQFLKHAKEHLEAPVTSQAIQEAEEIEKYDAQEVKNRSFGANIEEALKKLKREEERELAATVRAIELSGEAHIEPDHVGLRKSFSSLGLGPEQWRRALEGMVTPGEQWRRALEGVKLSDEKLMQAISGWALPGNELKQAPAAPKEVNDVRTNSESSSQPESLEKPSTREVSKQDGIT